MVLKMTFIDGIYGVENCIIYTLNFIHDFFLSRLILIDSKGKKKKKKKEYENEYKINERESSFY